MPSSLPTFDTDSTVSSNLPTFTARQYADQLATLVRADIAADPARYSGITDWSGLHTACDANEYLLDANDAFGYAHSGADEDVVAWNAWVAVTDEAIGIVEREMFPLPTV